MGSGVAGHEHHLPRGGAGRGGPGLVGPTRRRKEPRGGGNHGTDGAGGTPLAPPALRATSPFIGRTQAGVRTGASSTSSPDSRRSFSGMKLRTGGTRSKL